MPFVFGTQAPAEPKNHWAPAFAGEHVLSELLPASPRDAGWTGFVLAHLQTGKPLLWVQERMAILEGGRVHAAGLGPFGRDLIHVEARDARAALWAMEEGLRCSSLSGVVGEIWGDPQALDFTATRRLAVAAERTGIACWLVRPGGSAGLSGARERWRLASAPSEAHPFDPKAPGEPRWQAELFRSRRRAPGTWVVESSSLLPFRGGAPAAAGAEGPGALTPPSAASRLPPPPRGRSDETPLLPLAPAPGDRALGDPLRRTG